MKTWLATLLLLGSLSVAHAQPVPPADCPDGAVLLQITRRDEPLLTDTRIIFTYITTIYDSGRWTTSEQDRIDRTLREGAGCISPASLATVQRDLAKAPWKTTKMKPPCDGATDEITEYSVRGKPVWTARDCQQAALDDASKKTVIAISKVVDDVRHQALTSSVPTAHGSDPLPTCTPHGTPFFGLDRYDDNRAAKVPQLTLDLYANGAESMVVAPDNATAMAYSGQDMTGHGTDCLAKADLDAIRADLKSARWKVTHNRTICHDTSGVHTVVRLDGKQILDQRLCGADVLDDKSAAALLAIERQLHVISRRDPLPDVATVPRSP